MTITVTGRNGSEYDATHVRGDVFVVGKYLVRVIDGKCETTLCRATKYNVKLYSK